MKGYSQILACIDLTGEEDQVVEKAVQVAGTAGAALSLVHVVRPLNYLYAGDFPVDVIGIQEEIQLQAKKRMQQLAQQLSLKTLQQYIFMGSPQHEIHRLAKNIKADLIVIGTHGRHGLGLLLGSTANAVLHGTPCDVLVVRIKGNTDAPANES
jgi:universal stress protein A